MKWIRNKKSRTPKPEIPLKNEKSRTLNVEVIFPSEPTKEVDLLVQQHFWFCISFIFKMLKMYWNMSGLKKVVLLLSSSDYFYFLYLGKHVVSTKNVM